MYKLINDISEEVDTFEVLSESIKSTFEEEEVQFVLEGAEELIGKAIAGLKAGGNPFAEGSVDAEVITGLDVLTRSEFRDAHNIDRNKLSNIITTVDKKRQARDFVKQLGSKATKRLEELKSAEQKSPEKLRRHLTKLQMHYTKLLGQHQAKMTA